MSISDGSVEYEVRTMPSANDLGYRQSNTAYSVGNIAYHNALPTGWYLKCIIAGITANKEITPPISEESKIIDGTVTWVITNGQNLFSTADKATSDLNDISGNGVWYISDTTQNQPFSSPSFGVALCTQQTDLRQQIAISDGSMFLRTAWKNNWSTWQQQEAVVEKYLDKNGYIKYASGLILQWGTQGTFNANGIDIYYPISFTKVANIFITIKDMGDVDAKIITFSDLSDYEKFRPFSNQNSEAYNMSWFAIGC